MAIQDVMGETTTPKRFAQDLIMFALADKKGYWMEHDADGMTDREINLVCGQMQKECDRIAKRFGYEKSWNG